MPTPMIAESLAPLVATLAGCFTSPTYETFQHVLAGWILCINRHTVTGVLRASGAVGAKHHTSFHRFFRAARWCPDQLGLGLLRLVMKFVPANERIVVALDDTLGRHTGKKIRGASMHRDPLLSTRTRVFHHWGHVWVILAIVIRVRSWNKSFALPVLCRLYRSKTVCAEQGHDFYTKPQLAAQMLQLLARTLPQRQFYVVGDADYINGTVVGKRSSNIDVIGRARLDAALYALPTKQRMGRPRKKGERLPSPNQRAQQPGGWSDLTVRAYGRDFTVQVKVFDAIWYRVGGNNLMRFVLIRGWPGHDNDDVLSSSDLSLDAKDIIELFCLRWSIEVTIQEAKGKLGFEEPQNRTDKAVERTAPMALWVYTLTVLWYLNLDKRLKSAQLPQYPWYSKQVPAFSDMLAALRRETWRQRVLDPLPLRPREQKSIDSLLHQVGYAA